MTATRTERRRSTLSGDGELQHVEALRGTRLESHQTERQRGREDNAADSSPVTRTVGINATIKAKYNRTS